MHGYSECRDVRQQNQGEGPSALPSQQGRILNDGLLKSYPRREAGDFWCLPPVWNLRAVIWFHFTISSLVPLPRSVSVTLSVLGAKTHKRFKERFVIGRKRTRRANFWGSPLFQDTYNIKTKLLTFFRTIDKLILNSHQTLQYFASNNIN